MSPRQYVLILLGLVALIPIGGYVWSRWIAFPVYRQFAAIAVDGVGYGAPRQSDERALALRITYDWKRMSYVGIGSGGCNTWSGVIDLNDGGRFVFKEFGLTAQYCGDDGGREKKYVSTLRRMTHWRVEGSALILQNNDNDIRFEPAPRA